MRCAIILYCIACVLCVKRGLFILLTFLLHRRIQFYLIGRTKDQCIRRGILREYRREFRGQNGKINTRRLLMGRCPCATIPKYFPPHSRSPIHRSDLYHYSAVLTKPRQPPQTPTKPHPHPTTNPRNFGPNKLLPLPTTLPAPRKTLPRAPPVDMGVRPRREMHTYCPMGESKDGIRYMS